MGSAGLLWINSMNRIKPRVVRVRLWQSRWHTRFGRDWHFELLFDLRESWVGLRWQPAIVSTSVLINPMPCLTLHVYFDDGLPF